MRCVIGVVVMGVLQSLFSTFWCVLNSFGFVLDVFLQCVYVNWLVLTYLQYFVADGAVFIHLHVVLLLNEIGLVIIAVSHVDGQEGGASEGRVALIFRPQTQLIQLRSFKV